MGPFCSGKLLGRFAPSVVVLARDLVQFFRNKFSAAFRRYSFCVTRSIFIPRMDVSEAHFCISLSILEILRKFFARSFQRRPRVAIQLELFLIEPSCSLGLQSQCGVA